MEEQHLIREAERIHREALVLDAHFDLAMDLLDRTERGESDVFRTVFDPPFREGCVDCVVSSLFVSQGNLPEQALRRALDQVECLRQEIEKWPERLALCTTVEDIRSASASGRLAIMLSFEGAEPIGNDIRLLSVFHRLGVRGLGLVWSRRNYLADGCSFTPVEAGKPGGLTELGVMVVREAERLGMWLDVSHLNDEGFYDVMEISKKPLIASHSNCRKLVPSPRNLTDDQIRILAKKGGVMGMNGCSIFVGDGPGPFAARDLADHVDHVARIAGIEHVGLGLDFCDGFPPPPGETDMLPSRDVIAGHGRIPELTAELLRRGYSKNHIGMVLGENFMRVLGQILDS